MTKVPKYWNKAKKYLSKRDKIISKLIKNYQGPSEVTLSTRRDIFFSLVLMGLFHSVVEDTILMMLLGGSIWGFFWRCFG